MAEAKHEVQKAEKSIQVASDAFREGEAIPREFTCQGADVSPALTLGNIPDDATTLALVLDDPDAPNGTFTHWTAWNIPPAETRLDKGADLNLFGAKQGKNDFGSVGYRGPCPPQGEEHRYFLKVYAVDGTLDLEAGASVDQLYEAMQGKVVARGELMGTFKKT